MYMGTSKPACSRFGMTDSFVPFQPNTYPDGQPNPLAGKDDAILYGATKPDPGGLPLGTLEYLTFSRFYNAPGRAVPGHPARPLRAGRRCPAGTARSTSRPAGRSTATEADRSPIAPTPSRRSTLTVTPAAGAAVNAELPRSPRASTTRQDDRLHRRRGAGRPPAEGRFQRWGKWAEYDSWLEDTAPAGAPARPLGRAIQTMGVGETMTVPVVVHNWSDTPQSGTVTPDAAVRT